MKNNLNRIVNFLFELGILAKTPRSGLPFLGSGEQSVAEHINRTAYIGYVLSSLEKDVDQSLVLKMCLFHDIAEARTSDLNYVHQKYVEVQEEKAIKDMLSDMPFEKDLLGLLDAYKLRESKESLIAKDADNLEWLLSLKEQADIGNKRAEQWIPSAVKRLQTENAKKIASEIIISESSAWIGENDDGWWVHRNKGVTKKK
jgi:putative hydrolase of HD superfamily